jgi:DNA-binding NarL/FixJ family response regulator
MTETIRVVLVDDQPLLRGGVAAAVDAQPDLEVVGQAGTGVEALALLDDTEADVVLMDLRMPEMDGVEATRKLLSPERAAARRSPLRVIVLTTFALDDSARAAIRYGASGFLLKDTSPEFLIAAIRAVHGGGSVASPGDLGALLQPVTVTAPPPPSAFADLTDRERDVFDLAAAGLSNAEIGARLFLSESTVKTHLSGVLAKLGLRDRVQLVIFAHRHGLAPRPPDQPA